jgi:hypothetical protein
LLPIILVRNQIRNKLCGETGIIIFGKSTNLELRARRIPLCVQYICTLGGCGLQGCWYIVYDDICHAERFGLPLAKSFDRITALNPDKQKHSLKLLEYINRTAV